MKKQVEKKDWKKLTILHNEASTLCLRIDMMQKDYRELVEFSQSDDFKEFSESSQDVMLRSIDKKAARIDMLCEQYDKLFVNRCMPDVVVPIPITEKWLVDLGFKKEVLIDNSGYYYTLELNDNKYCDLAISSSDKNGFIEATLFPYEEWFRYKYVHELQNLFFAITGRELELKTDV